MTEMLKAYCYRSGQIEFGQKTPRGAIVIAEGPAQLVRETVEVSARHAYDGVTLLVTGIPEAENGDEALEALLAYTTWCFGPGWVEKRQAAQAVDAGWNTPAPADIPSAAEVAHG